MRKTIICQLLFLISIFTFQKDLWARNWQLDPSLTIQETYSDNVRLAPSGQEKSAFVTEISPGISFSRQTARNQVDLNYRMQNFFNAGGNDSYDLFHQFQFDSKTEFLRNLLFLDLSSSISQQNVSDIRSANDNISGGNNRTNVTRYGFSPYWTPHFHGYADGELRFRYEKLSTDRDRNDSASIANTNIITTNSALSDSETIEESIHLKSGWRFSRVTWAVNFVNREQTRERGNDVVFRNTDGLVRVHLNREFSLFAQAGYSDNSFQGFNNNRNRNGFFYTFGGGWNPSRYFGIEAGFGNNTFVTLKLSPTRHMKWDVTYRNNDIGTNTGSTWESHFEWKTRRATWTASYSEETSTVQNLLSDARPFTQVDATGQPVIDPVTNQPFQRDISLPTLVDEVFISKRGEISFSYRTGKTDINARVFNVKRIFQVSGRKDDVFGASADLDWRFTRRTSFFARSSWQKRDRKGSSLLGSATNIISTVNNSSNFSDNRFDFSLGLIRRIPFRLGKNSRMNARIEYRYLNQTSDSEFNEFQENRISASLQMSL